MNREIAGANLGHNSLRVEVVKNMEQLVQMFALRAICFMEDTGLPYDHAFDGNDLQATHIVEYDGQEPIGTVRVRWFREFAKIERTAFRKSHRSIPNIKVLADFTFAHIARKGYSLAITHASPIFARLWRTHFGFKPVPGKSPVEYHGEKYFELMRPLDVPDNAIALETPVAVLFRTEGEWDTPAKYETQ
jgi:predicted GNAT family N-acyltransferase